MIWQPTEQQVLESIENLENFKHIFEAENDSEEKYALHHLAMIVKRFPKLKESLLKKIADNLNYFVIIFKNSNTLLFATILFNDYYSEFIKLIKKNDSLVVSIIKNRQEAVIIAQYIPSLDLKRSFLEETKKIFKENSSMSTKNIFNQLKIKNILRISLEEKIATSPSFEGNVFTDESLNKSLPLSGKTSARPSCY